MPRLFTVLFVLFSLLATSTPSADVPEIELFDPDEFEQAFARLSGDDPKQDDSDEDDE